jgi:hypothetical protein
MSKQFAAAGVTELSRHVEKPMAWTLIMIVTLVVSYGLMFGLVRFTENVIATPGVVPAPGDAARAAGAERPR